MSEKVSDENGKETEGHDPANANTRGAEADAAPQAAAGEEARQENERPDGSNVDEDGDRNNDSDKRYGSDDDVLSAEETLTQLLEAQETIQRQESELLRAKAEVQNQWRRAEQDIEKAHKYGQEKFVSELLPVIDNLERALQAAGGRDDEVVRAIAEGVELTLKSFVDCFRKFNIEQLDPQGEPFDPQYHQAMSMQESPDVEPETVVAVMQKGYTLNGRVIRPAMVMVSKAPSSDGNEKA